MGILAKIFGSDTVINSGVKMIDNAFFTKEEKAGHFVHLLRAYAPFKIAQRFMAIIVGVPFVLLHILAGVLIACSIESGAVLAEWNNATLGQPFSIILLFYFGGGMLEGFVNAKNKAVK